jgi:Na+/H+ antiporter NhaC
MTGRMEKRFAVLVGIIFWAVWSTKPHTQHFLQIVLQSYVQSNGLTGSSNFKLMLLTLANARRITPPPHQ